MSKPPAQAHSSPKTDPSNRTKLSPPSRDMTYASALEAESTQRNVSVKSCSYCNQKRSVIVTCVVISLALPLLNASWKTLLSTSETKADPEI